MELNDRILLHYELTHNVELVYSLIGLLIVYI